MVFVRKAGVHDPALISGSVIVSNQDSTEDVAIGTIAADHKFLPAIGSPLLSKSAAFLNLSGMTVFSKVYATVGDVFPPSPYWAKNAFGSRSISCFASG
jgi:hypothetical protein